VWNGAEFGPILNEIENESRRRRTRQTGRAGWRFGSMEVGAKVRDALEVGEDADEFDQVALRGVGIVVGSHDDRELDLGAYHTHSFVVECNQQSSCASSD